jgi:hypothetical protein
VALVFDSAFDENRHMRIQLRDPSCASRDIVVNGRLFGDPSPHIRAPQLALITVYGLADAERRIQDERELESP